MKDKIINILKFVCFILLLPVVVTGTMAFIKGLEGLPYELTAFFVQGILIYLIIHVFLYEPKPVYQYGQNIMSAIFGFFAPLVKVAPFVLPIYSMIFLILFYLASLIFKSADIGHYFMFLVSFTLTMHMVFTAKALRDKDTNVIKPNYLFAMSLIYVVDISIMALMLGLILADFSFPQFFSETTRMTGSVYHAVFFQLFVPD
ncbi:MAG TPA: hypothetical protein PL155_09185 [Candidatus Omnitrophota bacterium]|nr:hypothetical protein [Candidatus Omnitrophota bacterium]HPD85652.1 hypothetical protein [Candidatus Omnitrophota bacterium]HRZ04495.1 hypothetical protein [Candidatus Omnitrophota bacterium]